MNRTIRKFAQSTILAFGSAIALTACLDSNSSNNNGVIEQHAEKTFNQTLMTGSPWATTGVFLVTEGKVDKSTNFISDNAISSGTISSAQYHNGLFIFVFMSDYTTGSFNEDATIAAIKGVTAGTGTPSGFMYGDYEMIRDGQGNDIRRITNPSFNTSVVIDRIVTVATDDEFGYIFEKDGKTYYVEHKPYTQAYAGVTFPAALQDAVDAFFAVKYTTAKQVDYNLKVNSPWATTAIYLQVDDTADTSVNYISDPVISSGTISSAQYRDGKFIFLSMSDYTTGEFNETALVSSLTDVANGGSPAGFSFGDYKIIINGQDKAVRRITNASFAPTATIDRTITEASEDKFTYLMEKDGVKYYVEHKRYAQAFSEATYPKSLQTAVDATFTATTSAQ